MDKIILIVSTALLLKYFLLEFDIVQVIDDFLNG